VDGERCLAEVNALIIFRKLLFQQAAGLEVATFGDTFHLNTVDVLKPRSLVHDVLDAHVARRDELAELRNSTRTIANRYVELDETTLSYVSNCIYNENRLEVEIESVNIVSMARDTAAIETTPTCQSTLETPAKRCCVNIASANEQHDLLPFELVEMSRQNSLWSPK